jgi:dienelactone hydrolase
VRFRRCLAGISMFVFLVSGAAGGVPALSGSDLQSKAAPEGDPRSAARHLLELLAAGAFAEATQGFDAAMKEGLPAEKLGQTWGLVSQQAGRFQREAGVRSTQEEGYRVVYVTCFFEKAPLDLKVVFDRKGRIAGLFFVPPRDHAAEGGAYEPPDYAQPGSFQERQVTVGSGKWALPGTLLLPAGTSPVPGLILVHGSGPQDRDETIGPNKPFRDLAAGLASRGIAVLRYDKRTLAHRAEAAALGDRLTLQEETVDDAAAAASVLRTNRAIDGRRVFVLGHSLGGVAVPRIAALDGTIAGFILMAAPSRPLEETLLEQATYLATLDGASSEEQQAGIETLRRQIARLRDPNLAKAAAPDDLPLGLGRSYWLDLRRGTGPEAVARLRRPLLVLRGGRDYQVTDADFRGWKEGLAGRAGVEFKLYPRLNHLFMAGEGKSTPAEYETAGHVAKEVIDDLAAWIKNRPAAGGSAR